MKRLIIGLGLGVLVAGGAMSIMAMRFEARIKPNTFVGIVPVGDLSKDEAMKKLRIWWENEKRSELTLRIPQVGKELRATPGKLGYVIDDVRSIESLPMDSFWDSASRSVGMGDQPKKEFPVFFKSNGQDTNWVSKWVESSIGEKRPARVRFENGAIVREPEISGSTVDVEKLPLLIESALERDMVIDVPIIEAEKSIPDEVLAQMSDVVSEFSTRFPVGQVSRNANLRIASGKIDGKILMPGEVFSFNETVGKRTMDEGYRLAPVLVSGRHDVGVGGGICQVSGTLYNAALLANLKIVQRSNHSAPVTYLPMGRDATVSYPSLDFKFQNNTDTPIAISSSFETGRLTFRLIGKKDPSTEVKIQSTGARRWGNGVKYVDDRSLPAGKQRVVEKGASGGQVSVFRVVYKDGQEVKRESLGTSTYRGSPRIVAVNRSAPRAATAADGTQPESPAPTGDEEFLPPPQ